MQYSDLAHMLHVTFVLYQCPIYKQETEFLAHRIRVSENFYPGIENLILPFLSYPGCHVRATCISCIGTHAYGRQVTSLLCENDATM